MEMRRGAGLVDPEPGDSVNLAGMSWNSRAKKLGPVLLELRQLSLHCDTDSETEEEHMYEQSQEDEKEEHETEEVQRNVVQTDHTLEETKSSTESRCYRQKSSLGIGYLGRTIAVSRGIVASSVASTCLSFRRDHRLGGGAGIQCATGLTSGYLCVHTIKNIQDYLMEQFDDTARLRVNDDFPILDSANSDDAVVSYFQYQHRSNRPASAVAWRYGSGVGGYARHVAIGLVGSSGGDRGGSTHGGSHYGQTGASLSRGGGNSGIAAATGSGNTDREYCCLVWDVEAQGSGSAKGIKQSESAVCMCCLQYASTLYINHILSTGCTLQH